MASQPAAFMSYARFDDRHEDGQLSQFRERLGVAVFTRGRGILEDNDITRNGFSGVQIGMDGDYNRRPALKIFNSGSPVVRGNRINRNRGPAVAVYAGGKGVFEDNDLTANQRGAWSIDEDCIGNVTQARNRE
jgi:F-box protein 11